MWLMLVTEKMSQKIFCQKHLFSEFRPLEFGLEYEKYEIAEVIHTNCVIHFKKLVVLPKDFHMKFISKHVTTDFGQFWPEFGLENGFNPAEGL